MGKLVSNTSKIALTVTMATNEVDLYNSKTGWTQDRYKSGTGSRPVGINLETARLLLEGKPESLSTKTPIHQVIKALWHQVNRSASQHDIQ